MGKSTKVNQQRLAKMKKQHEVLGRITEDSKAKIRGTVTGGTKVDFLKKLIAQGLLMLLEENVEVRCRKSDESDCKAAFQDAATLYRTTILNQTSQAKVCNLSLSASNLSDDSLGGVILSCKDGSITIDNTIDARLQHVMDQAKPQIRKTLFVKSKERCQMTFMPHKFL